MWGGCGGGEGFLLGKGGVCGGDGGWVIWLLFTDRVLIGISVKSNLSANDLYLLSYENPISEWITAEGAT